MSGTSATNPGNDVTSRNRTQQNPEPLYPGLHSVEEAPATLLAAKMFCCLPLPGGRGLSRPQRESVWERGRRWLRDRTPPRGIWPFARRNRKGTREPQAGPGHLYRPTRVTLSPFPECVDGISWGNSASSMPRQMWLRSLWAGCVHNPGQSRLSGMGRVQEALAAQEDPMHSGASTSSRVGA